DRVPEQAREHLRRADAEPDVDEAVAGMVTARELQRARYDKHREEQQVAAQKEEKVPRACEVQASVDAEREERARVRGAQNEPDDRAPGEDAGDDQGEDRAGRPGPSAEEYDDGAEWRERRLELHDGSERRDQHRDGCEHDAEAGEGAFAEAE